MDQIAPSLRRAIESPASGNAQRQGPGDSGRALEQGLRFRAYQGAAGLATITPEWTARLAGLPDTRFMHMPQWYRAYLASKRCDAARIWFVAAYRQQELVAVFPLQFQQYRASWLQPRLIGTIDDCELQLCDFVFAPCPENANLLCELTAWLRRQRDLRWDEIRLRKVCEDSRLAGAARSCLPRAMVTLRHDGSAYFDTSSTYEHATQAISGTFKRNLRRLSRRAEDAAPLRFESCQRQDQIDQAFDTFIALEASGWKGTGGTSTAIRCDPAMLTFYRELVREYSASGACVINLLWHGQDPVAAQFCLRIGRTLNILKIGFSDAHASFAPGNLLLERTIRDCCEDPGISVLSLVNEPPWAHNFKPLTRGVWSYNAPNWNLRGMLVHLALLLKRRWDARHPKAPLQAAAAVRE